MTGCLVHLPAGALDKKMVTSPGSAGVPVTPAAPTALSTFKEVWLEATGQQVQVIDLKGFHALSTEWWQQVRRTVLAALVTPIRLFKPPTSQPLPTLAGR